MDLIENTVENIKHRHLLWQRRQRIIREIEEKLKQAETIPINYKTLAGQAMESLFLRQYLDKLKQE